MKNQHFVEYTQFVSLKSIIINWPIACSFCGGAACPSDMHVANLQTKLMHFTFIFPDKGKIRAGNIKAKLSICHCVFILLFC